MGDRRGLGLRAAPDLDDHDRLVELERAVGEREEPLRALEALEEQDHGVRLGVVEAVGEEVARVEDDLAAAADDPREADPVAGVDERVGDRARLGDPGDAAARLPRVDVADVGRGVRGPVDHAHAVGSEERDPVVAGDRGDLALHPGRGLAALDDAAAGDDDARHAGAGRVLDDRGRAQRVDRDQDAVRDLRQRGERRVAGLAVELLVARVHEVAAGRAAHHPEVVRDGLGDPAAGGRTDDGDRTRGEQRPEVDRREAMLRARRSGVARRRLRAHPTTRATPRRSRARAMISRWISDVPSQIRSTRSSRKKRSAAFSRM